MRTLFFTIVLLVSVAGFSQIHSGKIVFERRTNLEKKFTDERMRQWLKGRKIKIDVFELYFNDTLSVFKPQETDLVEQMDWTTSKNKVMQDLKNDERLSILGVWGDELLIKDSLLQREWKVTKSIRNIAGYDCRRVIWNKNDSTRIHAWFTQEIFTPSGPETFYGLPGMILGLATEDGGVVYFAKSVEIGLEDITPHILVDEKNKALSEADTRAMLDKKFGRDPRGKRMIDFLFEW